MADMYKNLAMNILLPLVMAGLLGMFSWMNKLEDRQYALQREAVTEQKLGQTESRIMNYMDVRMKDMDNKIDLVLRQLDKLDANMNKKEAK
jgi:hypothetical protein